ncbi:MAG: dihydrodipicolinate synthase family protein [Phycisphaeraceae bacterium]
MNSRSNTRGGADDKLSGARVRGVLPVFQMPYHEDESIDFDTLSRQIDWLYEQGVDGLVLAMVSEVLRLTDDERYRVTEHVCKHSAGRGAVIISVGAESTVAAEAFARHAEQAGADAVMAIPPVSIGAGEDELRRYYERLLKAVSIPVIVQDASGYVGKPMSIELQANLLREYGQRVMFKPEAEPIGPRLTALREATQGEARVFEGSAGIALMDTYRRGVTGTMPGADVIQALIALWRALESGDERRAYDISDRLTSLVTLQGSLDTFLAVEKHLLVRQGIFRNTIVRGPVGFVMDDETRAEVDRRYDRLMEAVGSAETAQ